MRVALKWVVGLLVLGSCGASPAGPPKTSGSVPTTPLATKAPVDAPVLQGVIVFSRAGDTFGDETVFVARADGTGERRLTNFDDGSEPRLRHDGQQVAYATTAPDGRPAPAIVNVDGSGRRVLPVSIPDVWLATAVWSHDGTKLALHGENPDDPMYHGPALDGLYVMSARDGSGLRRISEECSIPGDFSPDGSQIVCKNGTTGQLYVIGADGSNPRQLTPNGTDVWSAGRWSPDGQHIMFEGSGRSNGSIWLVNPDGSQLTELYRPGVSDYALSPAWSPDGRYVIFAIDHGQPDSFQHPPNQAWVIRVDGSGLTRLISTPDFKRNFDWAGQ